MNKIINLCDYIDTQDELTDEELLAGVSIDDIEEEVARLEAGRHDYSIIVDTEPIWIESESFQSNAERLARYIKDIDIESTKEEYDKL